MDACGLGLWQTAAQYFFYYSAVALLTGAMGGILNSTQSFMGVILAHFLYGNKDRLTPRLFFISSAHITYPAPEMNARNSSTGIPAALCGCRPPPIAKPRTASASPPTPRLSTLTEKLSACWVTALFHGPASAKMTDAISIKAMPFAVFGLIIPIMNVLLSALLNGEPLFEWNYLAALVLVCIGIFLVNRAPQTQETKA